MWLVVGVSCLVCSSAVPGVVSFVRVTYVSVNVNNLLAISESDFDKSGEPGPQAAGVNHLETPLRQLHVTHRASSCAQRGGHVQLCSEPRGSRGIEPETFQEGVIVYLVLRPLDPHVLTSLIPICVVCVLDVQVHGQAGCSHAFRRPPRGHCC